MEKILSQRELDELASVIGEMEHKTSGELRLMIVGRSTPIGHVFPLSAFGLMSLSLLVLWFLRFELLFTDYWYLPPLLMAGSLVVAWFASRFACVRRMLTSSKEMQQEVWKRAQLEFHEEGLDGTRARTGVLIFLSLMEHQAVVLADKAVASKLDGEVWKDVIRIILQGAARREWRAKLEEAVRVCGKVLADNFPLGPGDVNELPNHVIVKP